jgi:hypothetical protein
MTTATTAHGATAPLPSRLVAGVTGGLVGGVMFGVLTVRPRLHRS